MAGSTLGMRPYLLELPMVSDQGLWETSVLVQVQGVALLERRYAKAVNSFQEFCEVGCDVTSMSEGLGQAEHLVKA